MQEKKLAKAEKVLSALKTHYGLKTYGKLAAFLGVTEGALYSWKSRGVIGDYAPILSKCKGINPEWLETGEGEMFERGDSSGPNVIPIKEIPVLGRISAGFPNLATQEVIEYISIPGTPENGFALVVRGGSMEPSFRDGDYVIFVEDADYKSNDVLIVLDEWGEAMVKRLKEKGGKRYLVSDNPAYPVVEPNEHFRVIGKVVKVWRDIKF